jgi:predicted DNA-binding protein
VGLVCEDLVRIIPEEFLNRIVEVSVITHEYTEVETVLLGELRESLQALFERHATEISLRYPSCVREIVERYIEDVRDIANYISEHRRIGEGLEETTLKLSGYLLEFIEPACSRKPCRNMEEVEDVVERLIIEGYKEIIVEFIQIGRHYTDNIQRLVEIFSRRGFKEYKRDTNPEEQSDSLRIRITFHRVE